MRSQIDSQAESQRRRPLPGHAGLTARCLAVSLLAVGAFAILFAVAFVESRTASAQAVPAQANPAQANPAPAAAPGPKPVHSHKKQAPPPPTPAPPPVAPPAPVVPPPNWPANDLPGTATVVFDSRGLLIVASNSSLAQILKDVSLDTGAKVEGMDADQRVFGTYGPGPARDVISQLLDGSGYDVLLVGDRGQGTPRRIVLTERSGAGAAPRSIANNAPPPNNEDTEPEEPPEPQPVPEPPQSVPSPNAPPVPIRTPQQIMEEIQREHRQPQNGQQNPQN